MAIDSSTGDKANSATSQHKQADETVAGMQPPRISVGTTIAATVLGAGLVARVTGASAAVLLIAISSAGFAVVVYSINHDHMAFQLAGNLVAPVTGFGFVLGVLLGGGQAAAALPVGTLAAYLALGGAIFGATATRWAEIGDQEIYHALGILLATVFPATLIVGIIVWQTLAAAIQRTLRDASESAINSTIDLFLTASPNAAITIASFFSLIAVTLFLVSRALDTLPFAELASRNKTEAIETTVSKVRRSLRITAFVCVGSFFGSLAIFITGQPPGAFLPRIVTALLVGLAAQPVIRIVAAVLGAVSLVVLALVWLVETITGISRRMLVRRAVPLVGGTLIAGLVLTVASGPIYQAFRVRSPPIVAGLLTEITAMVGVPVFVLSLVLGLLSFFIGITALPVVLAGTGFLPKRTAAPALAGGGLVFIGILHGVLGGGALLVFTFIALGAVAWDVGEYAVTLGGTVGEDAPTTQTEIVHAVVSMVSAATAVVVALIMVHITDSLTVTQSPHLVLLLAGLAFLFFIAGLRG